MKKQCAKCNFTLPIEKQMEDGVLRGCDSLCSHTGIYHTRALRVGRVKMHYAWGAKMHYAWGESCAVRTEHGWHYAWGAKKALRVGRTRMLVPHPCKSRHSRREAYADSPSLRIHPLGTTCRRKSLVHLPWHHQSRVAEIICAGSN